VLALLVIGMVNSCGGEDESSPLAVPPAGVSAPAATTSALPPDSLGYDAEPVYPTASTTTRVRPPTTTTSAVPRRNLVPDPDLEVVAAPSPTKRIATKSATAKSTATRAADSGSTSYKNCTAVRAAGKAPIRRGQPGYASHLDGDNDGVGCDT